MLSTALLLCSIPSMILGSDLQISTNVGEFNDDYAVYLSYKPTTKTRIPLSLIDGNGDILLRVTPRYNDDYKCGKNLLILQTRFDGIWRYRIWPSPSTFSFVKDRKVSVTAIPTSSSYSILFDFGTEVRKYEYPFQRDHKPEDIVKIAGGQYSHCSKTAVAELYDLSLGRVIPSLELNCVLQVFGSAASTGEQLSIDVSLGGRTERDRSPVALRIVAEFGTVPQIQLQHQEGDELVTLKTVANPIKKGAAFAISVTVNRYNYQVAVNEDNLATYPLTAVSCDYSGEATVWVTGADAVSRIVSSSC